MNDLFKNAEILIKKDIQEVFEEIWQELDNTYFTSNNFELSYIQETIGKRLMDTFINKNLLLVDTVLNYLTQDARKSLDNTDAKTVNQFYDWNRQQVEKLKDNFKTELQPKTIKFPKDNQLLSGAVGVGTGATGTIGTVIMASRTVGAGVVATSLPITILLPMGFLLSALAGYAAYKTTYRISLPWAIEQSKLAIKDNLKLVEEASLDRLLKVIKEYEQEFIKLGYHISS